MIEIAGGILLAVALLALIAGGFALAVSSYKSVGGRPLFGLLLSGFGILGAVWMISIAIAEWKIHSNADAALAGAPVTERRTAP
jgi:hypothetical protein